MDVFFLVSDKMEDIDVLQHFDMVQTLFSTVQRIYKNWDEPRIKEDTDLEASETSNDIIYAKGNS
jgi:hypothetical protein